MRQLLLTVLFVLTCTSAIGQSQELKVTACRTFSAVYFLPDSTGFLADTAFYSGGVIEGPMHVLSEVFQQLALHPSVCICVIGNYAMNEDPALAQARAQKVIRVLLAAGINADQLRWAVGGPENRQLSDRDRSRLASDEERNAADVYNRDVTFTYCDWWRETHRVD